MRILLIFSILAVVLTTAAQQQQRRRSLMGSASTPPATPDFTFITNAVSGGDASTATTPARDTTGANLFVVWVASYGGDVSSIHDFTNGVDTGTSTSYVALTNVPSPGAQRIQGFYLTNVITGTSHTFVANCGGGFPSIAVQCFSVVGGAVPTLDAQSGNLSGSTTSNQPGSRTPSQDKCLVASGNTHLIANEDMAVTPLGSLVQTNYFVGGTVGLGVAHDIQTTAAASNPTWSWTTADVTACAQAIFKK